MNNTEFEKFCDSTRALLRNRTKHLSVEFVLDGLRRHAVSLPSCIVIVREKKFFRTEDEFSPQLEHLLFKHLSFAITDGSVSRYDSHRSVENDYLRKGKFVAVDRKNVEISTPYKINGESHRMMSYLADLIEDLYVQNIYPDIVAASARKFVSLASDRFGTLTLENLLDYLSSEYEQASGISLITYKYTEAIGSGERRRNFEMEVLDVSDYGYSLGDISDELAETIKYCATSGRMSDGYYKTDEGAEIHYAILPANVDHNDIDETTPSRSFVVVFSEDEELDEFLVRFLEIGVSRLEQREKNEGQASIVAKLSALKRDLQSKIRRGTLATERTRNAFVKPRLSQICEELREHVGAHSVTIRTYNPFSEELELYLESCERTAFYRSVGEKNISVNRTDSVNVQCFKDKNPEDHIYKRSLNQRSKHKDEAREIPYNPRGSKCEACFPIWKSGTPHGTLNVEAATENALSRYIQFLKWVSMLISEISTETSNALSSNVADQLSRINELAHGTLDANPAILDDMLEGRTATERKVVAAWQKYALLYRKPSGSVLGSEDDFFDLFQLASDELERAVRSVPYFQYKGGEVYVPKAIKISGQEARNVRGILRSLLSNAVKHAGFDEGNLRIFGLFRANRPYIFIRYSTKEAIVPCSIIDQFGTAPVIKHGEVRYGAFLMAERVRSADGSFFVERPSLDSGKYCRLRLSIAIPLDEES